MASSPAARVIYFLVSLGGDAEAVGQQVPIEVQGSCTEGGARQGRWIEICLQDQVGANSKLSHPLKQDVAFIWPRETLPTNKYT